MGGSRGQMPAVPCCAQTAALLTFQATGRELLSLCLCFDCAVGFVVEMSTGSGSKTI